MADNNKSWGNPKGRPNNYVDILGRPQYSEQLDPESDKIFVTGAVPDIEAGIEALTGYRPYGIGIGGLKGFANTANNALSAYDSYQAYRANNPSPESPPNELNLSEPSQEDYSAMRGLMDRKQASDSVEDQIRNLRRNTPRHFGSTFQ